jgi:hypothetical protein
LWDTPICFLGSAYLLLLIWILLQPPSGEDYVASLKGHPQTASASPTSPQRGIGCCSGGAWRWLLPWLLGCLAAADLMSQFGLAAAAQAGEVPQAVSDFLRRVCGIDAAAGGGALWMALLRPVALIAGISVYRCVRAC